MASKASTIRWGILGTGKIAHAFASALRLLPDAQLVAVGSRSAESAGSFADLYEVPHRHDTYESLARDPDIDIVYIASPHSHHAQHALLCLEAGKAVLCEKAFTLNAREAQTVIDAARARNLFLMEAMWTRFIPAVAEARQLIAAGAIGKPMMLQADFGVRFEVDASHRLVNPQLGGGALLDLGIYPISLAAHFMGAITNAAATGGIGATQVDDNVAISLAHAEGGVSTALCGFHAHSPREALIVGTEGQVRLHGPFYKTTGFTIKPRDGEPYNVERRYEGNGYQFEAAHAMQCLRDGLTESPVMPLDETLAIMRVMDRVREQIGMRYACD
jgi:predicted dehydrogenase